jgi:hypothetical protein
VPSKTRPHILFTDALVTTQVDWRTADALRPETYAELLPEVGGVVHTLGVLLEDGGYKEKVRNGDVLGVLGALVGGGGGNPLSEGSYEVMNRDAGACFRSLVIAS